MGGKVSVAQKPSRATERLRVLFEYPKTRPIHFVAGYLADHTLQYRLMGDQSQPQPVANPLKGL